MHSWGLAADAVRGEHAPASGGNGNREGAGADPRIGCVGIFYVGGILFLLGKQVGQAGYKRGAIKFEKAVRVAHLRRSKRL